MTTECSPEPVRRHTGRAWPTRAHRASRAVTVAREHKPHYDERQPSSAASEHDEGAVPKQCAVPSDRMDAGALARHGLEFAGSAPRHDVPEGSSDAAPFGLPVLDELPELAALLTDLRAIDRLVARCLTMIRTLADSGHAEAATGLGLDAWINLVARRTGADVRMLRTAANTCRRIPSLGHAFDRDLLSWAQVRSITLAVQRLPAALDDRIDAAVAEGIAGAAGAEPDAVTRVIRWSLASLEEPEIAADEAAATTEEYLAMQPRLDGTGGRFWGEAGPVTWAILDAALNGDASPPPGGARRGFAGDRSETAPPAAWPGRAEPTGEHAAAAWRAGGSAMRRAGAQRLQRLVDLLDATLPGGQSAGDASAGSVTRASRPQLILRADLATLLDRDRVPGTLLTTLLGGHVRVSAGTARRLIDERGADLRTVLLDDTGAVVGVGRRRRVPPRWLRDAMYALHDTCSAPTCDTAARVCDADHAVPWHPARPGDAGGHTTVEQVAPLCGRDNRAKERGGWRARQLADGSRRWHHERSGVTTRTVPVTWHPPP